MLIYGYFIYMYTYCVCVWVYFCVYECLCMLYMCMYMPCACRYVCVYVCLRVCVCLFVQMRDSRWMTINYVLWRMICRVIREFTSAIFRRWSEYLSSKKVFHFLSISAAGRPVRTRSSFEVTAWLTLVHDPLCHGVGYVSAAMSRFTLLLFSPKIKHCNREYHRYGTRKWDRIFSSRRTSHRVRVSQNRLLQYPKPGNATGFFFPHNSTYNRKPISN